MKYNCHDIFMIRTPALSLHNAEKMYEQDYKKVWEYIVNSELQAYMMEALLISSPELYEAVKRLGKNKKADKATYLGLYKYLIRASSRPTPYGILANIALGKFKNDDVNIINTSNVKKYICADSLWVNKLINELECRQDILQGLSLSWNKNCYISRHRVRNPFFSSHGILNKIKKTNLSIRYTNLIDFIMKNTDEMNNYSHLANLIHEKYPDVKMEQIKDTIDLLIEQEFLFTDLRLPVYCEDALDHILFVLKKNDLAEDMQKKIALLKSEFLKYEGGIGSEIILNRIIEIMKGIMKCSHYIEVNSGTVLKKPLLNIEVKQRLENFVNCIYKIGVEDQVISPLRIFREQFQEEFGIDIEVPLSEVIDPSGFDGLKYYEKQQFTSTKREQEIRNIFDSKIQRIIRNGGKRADFFKDDFANIYWNDKWNTSMSFDINFIITQNEGGTELTLGPNFGASVAGKSFQRFERVFNGDEFKLYNTIYRKTNSQEPLMVELRELPSAGRMCNIINWKRNYPYYFALGMPYDILKEHSITLDDIVIGLDKNRKLYLKSISKDVRCKMVMDNMLNTMINSKLLNLLKDISSSYDDIKLLERFAYFTDNQYIYTPEIVFEGITISPEKWIIPDNLLNGESLSSFKIELENFFYEYNIPNFFYMCNIDNRLILHRDDSATLEILYQEFKRKKQLNLCAIEKNAFYCGIVKNQRDENYVTECVFSFYADKKNEMTKSQSKINKLIQNKERIILPFENGWLYLKLYCNKEMENDILRSFCEEQPTMGINDFFFVRYEDEVGTHIRLRIKYKNQKEALNYLPEVYTWLSRIKENGLVSDWNISEYHRENNRYGGADVIEEIEKVFFENSKSVIDVLKNNDLGNEEQLLDVYFYTVATFLFQLLNDKRKMLLLLEQIVGQNDYRSEYKEKRKHYIDVLDNLLNKSVEQNVVTKIMKTLNIHFDTLTTKIDDIVLSLIHMCCNRLNGQRKYEQQIYCVLRHALYDVVQRDEHLS